MVIIIALEDSILIIHFYPSHSINCVILNIYHTRIESVREVEAAAQAIPRAKGGEESSSKKGYEYEYDEVTYMHNLYYGQLKFLNTAKDLPDDILDSATNPDIILNTEVKLEGITESLKRWEAIQPAISLVGAFDIIKNVKYTYTPLCYRRYYVSFGSTYHFLGF